MLQMTTREILLIPFDLAAAGVPVNLFSEGANWSTTTSHPELVDVGSPNINSLFYVQVIPKGLGIKPQAGVTVTLRRNTAPVIAVSAMFDIVAPGGTASVPDVATTVGNEVLTLRASKATVAPYNPVT